MKKDKDEIQCPFVSADNGEGYCIMYQTTARLLATDATLKFADVRVYLFLNANADYECKYSSTQTALAEELGLSYHQMSSSLKVLREKDLIRQQRVHGQLTFYINPNFITRGKDKSKLLSTYNLIPPKVVNGLGEGLSESKQQECETC